MTGSDVLKHQAPDVWAALGQLDATRPVALDDLLAEPAVVDLHDRFVVDPTSVDDELRTAFRAATGDRADAVMEVVYADDLLPRVITMHDNLFGLSVWPTYQDVEVDDLGPAVTRLTDAIDAIELLDPTTREAVRIRVAQLSGAPLPEPATDLGEPLDPAAIDRHPFGDLPGRLKAALALTDAYVRTPFDLVTAVAELVEQLLDPPTTVGVILTAARASRVKVGVALTP